MQLTSFKMVKDWRAEMNPTLNQALFASQDVFNRSAGEACKHAVILMAQSLASKGNPITPIAKKRRPIQTNDQGEYVERWRQGWSNHQKIYKWFFRSKEFNAGKNFRGSGFDSDKWEKAQIIRNAGLARRSWMWGLAAWGMGAKEEGSAISGTSEVIFSQTKQIAAAIKRNKLNYITKIMSSGWEVEATSRATNKILAQAARKMEQMFVSTLRGGNAGMARSVQSFFLPAAA